MTVEPITRVKILNGNIGFAIDPEHDVQLINLKSLEEWGQWSQVESAVKRMVKNTGPLTNEELATIRSCATTNGAKNGLAEFEQAYAQMRKV